MYMNNSINIKFKKLCKKAVVPTIATSGSVGMDLVATSRVETDKYIEYLEETLDALGVTVHRDVKGEIYLGSKGSDPSAK